MPHSFINAHWMSEIHKEVKEIYASTFLRAIAYSLVHVFVPAYLVELGYSINFALAFIGLFYGSLVFFGPWVTQLMSVYGSRKIFLLNPITSITYLLALYSIKFLPISNYNLLIALIGGLAMMLFWMPTNPHFARVHSYKNSAAETGLWVAISKTAGTIGPFIGGLVIINYGFGPLYAIATLILFCAAAPLLFIKDYKEQRKYKWKDVFSKENRHMFDEFFAQGFLAWSLVVLFPFYVFLQNHDFQVTGISASLTGIGVVSFVVLLGRLTDKYGKHRILRIGAVLHAIAWLFVYVSESTTQIYLASFFLGISWVLIDIPIFAIFCNHLEGKAHSELMAFREIALSSGRAIVPIIAIILPLALKFKSIFLLCSLVSVFFLFNDFYGK